MMPVIPVAIVIVVMFVAIVIVVMFAAIVIVMMMLVKIIVMIIRTPAISFNIYNPLFHLFFNFFSLSSVLQIIIPTTAGFIELSFDVFLVIGRIP